MQDHGWFPCYSTKRCVSCSLLFLGAGYSVAFLERMSCNSNTRTTESRDAALSRGTCLIVDTRWCVLLYASVVCVHVLCKNTGKD